MVNLSKNEKLSKTQELMSIYGEAFAKLKVGEVPTYTKEYWMSGITYVMDMYIDGKIFGQVYSPLGKPMHAIIIVNDVSYFSKDYM